MVNLFGRPKYPAFQQNTPRRKLLTIAIVVLLCLASIMVINKLTSKPLDSAFMGAVMKRDSKKSYQMTSAGFKFTQTEAEWDILVNKLVSAYTGSPKKVSEKTNPFPEYPDIVGQYIYEVPGDGGPYRITIYIVKDNGELKVSSFDSRSIKR